MKKKKKKKKRRRRRKRVGGRKGRIFTQSNVLFSCIVEHEDLALLLWHSVGGGHNLCQKQKCVRIELCV